MTNDTDRRPHGFRRHLHGRTRNALAGFLLLGGGVAAGAAAMQATRPAVTMAPATPVAIRGLSDGIVTVRGRAVELFGNKLVVEDATGRALVDLGREGEDGGLVRLGETVTAQGRFEHGFVHAAFLVGQDGKVRALGPLGGPPRHGPGGPGGRPGPDGRCDAPPPPPPGGDRPAPPPVTGARTAPVPAPAAPPAATPAA